MKKDDCIFCKIAAGEIPSRKIYEDSDLIAIMDLNPTSKGHSLIIPKDHCTNIYDIDEDIAAKVMKTAKKLATKMTVALNCDGFNLLQNNGETAGQTMFHFHMHLIPRYKDADNNMLKFTSVSFSDEEMDAIRDQIIKD
ncbi:MAG: HIT family protein [Lachnospiraceae bacterium]|nr:HIT family protein [Lachnospiraceae bacterium]